MFILGTLAYIIVILSYLHIKAISEMVDEALLLAPEISLGMLFLYILPLFIHIYHILRKKKTIKDLAVIDKQTKLAASISVSLGLIGTFQGLTAMVSAIAGSLGGDGDMMEKINTMMASISTALAAMSYAFLTSILGVAISVLLLISLNFWCSYYKGKDNSNTSYSSEALNEVHQKLESLSAVTVELNEKIFILSNSNEDNKNALEKIEKVASNLEEILMLLKESEARNIKGVDRLVSTLHEGFKLLILEGEKVQDSINNNMLELSNRLEINNETLKENFKKESLSIKDKMKKAIEAIYEI